MRLRVAFGVTFVASAAACAYDWSLPPTLDPEGPGVGDASTDGADASSIIPPSSEAGGRSCSPTSPCGNGLTCDYADHRCGSGDAGTCTAPGVCDPTGAPPNDPSGLASPDASAGYCACDGKIYATLCEAKDSGSDLGINACPLPPSSFECGYEFCNSGTLCVLTAGNPKCEKLPESCASVPVSCSCVSFVNCTCSMTGNITLTCSGEPTLPP